MKKYLPFPALLLFLATASLAAEPVLDSVRFVEHPDGKSELQTAILSMKNANGVQLDLISAVHIGDQQYYDSLNHIFKEYDVVLYEMVGGPVAQRDQEKLKQEIGGIQLVQRVMQLMLGFRYQLDGIDYSAPNFAHADVTWEEWTALNEARDQNFMTLLCRAMELENDPEIQAEMKQLNSEELSNNMVQAIMEFSPNKLKRSLAPLLANSETFITKLEGHDGTVVISERNKVLMDYIAQHTKAGQRKVGVFYGAGHMPDLVDRLKAEGYQMVDTRWVSAWHLPAADGTDATGWQAAENLLKDDSVVEGVFALLRQFLNP